MMGFYRSLSGQLRVRLTAADIPGALAEISAENVFVEHLEEIDYVTVQFTISRKHYLRLQNLVNKRGYNLKTVSRMGIFWAVKGVLKRPVLIAGLALLLCLGVFLPGRILFISVEGNGQVPERMILEAAQDRGLGFGTRRREIRSEQIKNALLEEIPQLQWAGVNTYGCRAVITVRERADKETVEEKYAVNHIVASRDGIITSCIVNQGNGLCTAGQAVRKGDILISGYTDCGITITASRADGEIFASTNRQLTVKTPATRLVRENEDKLSTKYSLIIGKNRINFYKGSGISGGSCVKMYSKYVLTLPGGFSLPVALVKESVVKSRLTEQKIDDPSLMLKSFAERYLKEQMIAGSVMQKTETVDESDGTFCLRGIYACNEMIGRQMEEKIGEFNGKTDGTDRER